MPKSFHDQLAEDMRDVFFNEEEYGKSCVWNGREIPFSEPPLNQVSGSWGSMEEMRVITCRKRDFQRRPLAREKVMIDRETWIVESVQEPLEAYVIALVRPTS